LGWINRSQHEFTIETLPPRHFKWRIRQASIGLAQKAKRLAASGRQFDAIFTTSILDAAELRGLLPPTFRNLPLVVYFHENQLVYPSRKIDARDAHFSLINWASALAADAAWFNSDFNRGSLLSGLEHLLKKMPDENSLDTLDEIRARSRVESLGLLAGTPQFSESGPLHIAWVGRWEHDKRPELFFQALRRLKKAGVDFRLTCLGQSFRSIPPAFRQAEIDFSEQLVHFGFVEDRKLYEQLLEPLDVVVSTADHEFFGLALLEAVGRGAIPLVPDRLVYPEIYPQGCLYDGSEDDLVTQLMILEKERSALGTLQARYMRLKLQSLVAQYDWSVRGPALDEALISAVQSWAEAKGDRARLSI
jgi:glycosyltransferase involved in cell wall biosynthesis